MGTFNVEIEVSDPQGQRSRTLDALVDTGATYPIIPRSVMEFLRIEVAERRSFVLADDRRAEFDVGVVTLRLAGRSFPVLAVFGNNSAQPVLGAVAFGNLRARRRPSESALDAGHRLDDVTLPM